MVRKYRPKYSKPLTEKETKVLCLMCLTNADIAHRTHRSINGIKQVRHIIFRKLGVHSRSEAIVTAIRQGLIDIWDLILPTDVF